MCAGKKVPQIGQQTCSGSVIAANAGIEGFRTSLSRSAARQSDFRLVLSTKSGIIVTDCPAERAGPRIPPKVFLISTDDMSSEANREELRKTLVAGQLPAMPHSALSILKLENDITKVNIEDLIRPIEADPGLAVQVLKFLNSSAFGFRSTIANIRQGVALVGVRTIKNFVLWKAVFSLIPKSKSGAFEVGMLWQDSLRRAMFARFLLLEMKRGDSEMAFAGALLQDMAIPLLMKVKSTQYSYVLGDLAKNRTKRLSELEDEFFSWNHADAALILGQHWKLPEILIDLTSNHLKAEEASADFAANPERAV